MPAVEVEVETRVIATIHTENTVCTQSLPHSLHNGGDVYATFCISTWLSSEYVYQVFNLVSSTNQGIHGDLSHCTVSSMWSLLLISLILLYASAGWARASWASGLVKRTLVLFVGTVDDVLLCVDWRSTQPRSRSTGKRRKRTGKRDAEAEAEAEAAAEAAEAARQKLESQQSGPQHYPPRSVCVYERVSVIQSPHGSDRECRTGLLENIHIVYWSVCLLFFNACFCPEEIIFIFVLGAWILGKWRELHVLVIDTTSCLGGRVCVTVYKDPMLYYIHGVHEPWNRINCPADKLESRSMIWIRSVADRFVDSNLCARGVCFGGYHFSMAILAWPLLSQCQLPVKSFLPIPYCWCRRHVTVCLVSAISCVWGWSCHAT